MAASAQVALAASGLVAGYRKRRRPLPVVTVDALAAPRGELTAVFGPNGSGKSTLLRTLVGAQPPLRGQVEVDGGPLSEISRADRARRLAVVLTDRVEPGLFSVGDVIALGRHPHTSWHGRLEAEDVAAAHDAAQLVGVAELWEQPFEELSDGQRQRVMVARALAQDPAVLVLDEPTAFLDVPGRVRLTVLLSQLAGRSDMAVVLSSHDLELTLGHADRVWLVHEGGVRVGTPTELIDSGELAAALDGGDPGLRPYLTEMMRAARATRPELSG